MPARPPPTPILAEDRWRAIREAYEQRFKKNIRVSYKSIAKEVKVSPHTVKRAWLIGWPEAGRAPLCNIFDMDYRDGGGGKHVTAPHNGTRIGANAAAELPRTCNPESVHIPEGAALAPQWLGGEADDWGDKVVDAAQRIAWGVTVQAAKLLESAMPISDQLSAMLKTAQFDTPERALRVLSAVHTFSEKAATLNDNVAKLARTLGGGPDTVVDLRVGEVSPAEAEAAVDELRALMGVLTDRGAATQDALARYGYADVVDVSVEEPAAHALPPPGQK